MTYPDRELLRIGCTANLFLDAEALVGALAAEEARNVVEIDGAVIANASAEHELCEHEAR